jgi:V/A-type H+-transporting ATPase subunit A
LSKELANARHYPAVDWTESFSDHVGTAATWWTEHADPQWEALRGKALELLSQADELARIVNLVGPEALSPAQRWTLEGAALLKEGILQQSALDEVDSYCDAPKQFALLRLLLQLYREGQDLLAAGVPAQRLLSLPLLARARRYKTLFANDQIEELKSCRDEIKQTFDSIRDEYAGLKGPGA